MDTDFDDFQRRLWQQQRRDLLEEYEAVQKQISYSLDAAQQLRLEREAKNLAQQIRQLDEKLTDDERVHKPLNSPTSSTLPSHSQLVELIDEVSRTFSLSELNDLCFRLGIEAEDIEGTTRSEKVRNLVLMLQRHSRLPDLITTLKTLRPTVSWERL